MKCPIEGKILSCPQDSNHQPNHPPMNCTNELEKMTWKYVSNEEVDSRIQYCIGYSWSNREDEWYTGLKLTRYGCKEPCYGKTPCIR